MAVETKISNHKMKELKLDNVSSDLTNWRVSVDKKNNNLKMSSWAPSVYFGSSVGTGLSSVAGQTRTVTETFGEKAYVIKYAYIKGTTLYFVDSNGNPHKAKWNSRYNNTKYKCHTNFAEVEKLVADAIARGKVQSFAVKGSKFLYPSVKN